MMTLDADTNRAIEVNETGNTSEADRSWQIAGERVFMYLRCLNFPAPQALELALKALKGAERNVNPDSGSSPVAEAMQALHQLLSEQKPGMFCYNRSPAAWREECLIHPLISLHRLPMVPEGMASAHWYSLFAKLMNRFRRSRPRGTRIP